MLDLADDYYEIASEAVYNYSKAETGKDLVTHKNVKMWHYFVNDIYFAEYGETELTPYTATINVKEKDDGDFVYSFNAEKESSTRRTLHAAVNTRKGVNGELFLSSSIHDSAKSSNTSGKKSRRNYTLQERIAEMESKADADTLERANAESDLTVRTGILEGASKENVRAKIILLTLPEVKS